MYTDLHCPNLYKSDIAEGEHFSAIETITNSITVNTAKEAFCKANLIMHGLDHWMLNSELRALNEVAKTRVKAAKEEADALAFGVDYERDSDSRIIFDWEKIRTSLHIRTDLPNPTAEEPFYSQEKVLNEIRSDLISIYIQRIIDFNILVQLERDGRLKSPANEVYLTAVKNVPIFDHKIR
jgi:hypothetical protein